MVELEIDGKKVEVAEGSLVMEAARQLGTYIPHFCYHRKLSIAANCRMCLVEIEKAPPKPQHTSVSSISESASPSTLTSRRRGASCALPR